MLEVKNINTFYGEVHVLYDLSIKVPDGAAVALLGRNGMGKTTTVNSIIGLVPPRNGTVYFNGEKVSKLRTYQIAERGIALVPQGRHVFQSLSVEENLVFGLKGGKNKSGYWNLRKIYDIFPRLEERANQKANRLSGGEQQMLAFGRALIMNPSLLLLDEPSEGLSPIMVQTLTDAVKLFKSTGISILLVEQNIGMVFDLSDYVYLISGGQVVFGGTVDELKKNEDAQRRYVGVGL